MTSEKALPEVFSLRQQGVEGKGCKPQKGRSGVYYQQQRGGVRNQRYVTISTKGDENHEKSMVKAKTGPREDSGEYLREGKEG